MQYMKVNTEQREEFLVSIAGMPQFLEDAFAGLNPEQARTRAPDGTPDFNGAKAAAERNYPSLSLKEGLSRFTDARRQNIAALRSIDGQAWFRAGTQEGVGRVSLCDIPSFMSQHDSAHKAEIETWRASVISAG